MDVPNVTRNILFQPTNINNVKLSFVINMVMKDKCEYLHFGPLEFESNINISENLFMFHGI